MKQFSLAIALLGIVCTLVIPRPAFGHDRKEVAGLTVVFGAEPEPALTGRVQNLRWRFLTTTDKKPYTDIQEAKAVIKKNGKEYGPFSARGSRRNPGLFQTMHIFNEAGEYEVALSFRKGKDSENHVVDFTFRIRDRKELEIPGKQTGN